MNIIPYSVVPLPNNYNIGVFFLTFNSRKDGRTMKEAFQYDFDYRIPENIVSYEDLIIYIMSLR